MGNKNNDAVRAARNAALEEAAKIAESTQFEGQYCTTEDCSAAADAIRALKGQPCAASSPVHTQPVAVPEGFVAYVRANYNGVVDIHRPEWHAERLRNVAILVGLGDAVPADDATLDGARGSVLGMIAGKLRKQTDAPSIPEAGAEELPQVLIVGESIELCHLDREGLYVAVKNTAPIRMPQGWIVAIAALKGATK